MLSGGVGHTVRGAGRWSEGLKANWDDMDARFDLIRKISGFRVLMRQEVKMGS